MVSTSALRVRAILLDIEGTTSPLQFVYEVLFPYARSRMHDFLASNWHRDEVVAALPLLLKESERDVEAGAPAMTTGAPEPWNNAAEYCLWLMSRDRKSTPLKIIQGMIWEQGFHARELQGEVFADVPEAFQGWYRDKRTIAIYSSGSVLAQKLLFQYSRFGDLSPYIAHYYDTRIGAKRNVESYRRILADMGFQGGECFFLSDVVEELDAARAADFHTALAVRDCALPSGNTDHPVIHSLLQVPISPIESA